MAKMRESSALTLSAEVGAVGILLVVHATISNTMDPKNNNRFAIGTSKWWDGSRSVPGESSGWYGLSVSFVWTRPRLMGPPHSDNWLGR